jgi:hypothetical protein
MAKTKGQNAFVRAHQKSHPLLLNMGPSGLTNCKTCLWTGKAPRHSECRKKSTLKWSRRIFQNWCGSWQRKQRAAEEQPQKRDKENDTQEECFVKKKPKVVCLSSLEALANKAIADAHLLKLTDHISEGDVHASFKLGNGNVWGRWSWLQKCNAAP